VLFSGADVDKRVALLSGGEAARLIFGLLAVQKPNVLVLDEPTNHLDLEAIHALGDALKAFTGTVIFVSHDRWFVSELATRVVEITPAGPRDFPGTYAEYLERLGDDHLDGDAVASRARAEKKVAATSTDGRPDGRTNGRTNGGTNGGKGAVGGGGIAGGAVAPTAGSWEEQKKRRNRVVQLPKLRDRLLADIEAAEARKGEIAALYADAGFFQRASRDEIDALVKEQEALGPRIEGLVGEWEAIEREIEGG
jgi:ABC-type glutathione transport system ATPase component